MKTLLALCVLMAGSPFSTAAEEPSLWPLQQQLVGKRLVDLTHAFAPGIPHWPGFPDAQRHTIYWYDKKPGRMGAGFFAEVFTHVGQWGTHVDPPAHFHKGGRTVDQITLKEMILPLVPPLRRDVHDEVKKNPDYTLTVERIKKWEADHGRIPAGAFIPPLRRDGLVEALAGRGGDGKQRRERCRALSGLESAGAEITLRKARSDRERPGDDRYRSGVGHE